MQVLRVGKLLQFISVSVYSFLFGHIYSIPWDAVKRQRLSFDWVIIPVTTSGRKCFCVRCRNETKCLEWQHTKANFTQEAT